jgi:hypothetical protein
MATGAKRRIMVPPVARSDVELVVGAAFGRFYCRSTSGGIALSVSRRITA